MQFLDPHVHSNCYHCFTKEEQESPSQMTIIGSSHKMKIKQLDDMSNMSPYMVVDDFMGENFQKTQSSQSYQQVASQYSGSKYSIPTFEISTHAKEEKQIEQGFDIFAGFRHWWKDNITSQKLISGLAGFADLDS